MATGWSPPTPSWYGVFEPVEQEQQRRDHRHHGADQHALDDRPLAAVGEEEHEDEDDDRDEEEHDPERLGMTPTAPWMRSQRASSRADV